MSLYADCEMLKLRLVFLLMFIVVSSNVCAQTYVLNGMVRDSISGEPLPFVNIVINNGPCGGISDIDGKFHLKCNEKPHTLKLSYVGYLPRRIMIEKQTNIQVFMQRSAIELSEVIILPGINPAHRIIQNATSNRDINNPYNLSSFSYTSYNRFSVSPDMDVLRTRAVNDPDTSISFYRDFFEHKYLFLMESVSRFKFLYPQISEEKVIASRVSGFSDPLFTLLMTQIQSFAFYEDLISISDRYYVNPISPGSTEKYLFLIQDTIYDNKDSIFVISYRPLKGTNFDGLEGLLYIHTDGWAIQNVTAKPAREDKGFGIRIQQQYTRTGKDSVWFPQQLNTEILFKNVSLNKLELFGQGRTYLFDVEINPPLKKRQFSDAQIIFEPDDVDGEKLLGEYSSIYGSSKDKTTYSFLDSLSKAENLERTLGLIKVLLSGNIPVWIFDMPLLSLVNFNDFEGWRLGMGLQTNTRLMEKFSAGGYAAYGFLDKQWKYGTHLQYHNKETSDLKVKALWKYDVYESGGMKFSDIMPNLLDVSSYRDFMVDLMDYHEELKIDVSGRFFRHTNALISMKQTYVQTSGDYLYGTQSETVFIGKSDFSAKVLSLGFRYDPNVKIIKGLDYQLALVSQSPKPILKFEYQYGFSYPGDVSFQTVDVWLRKTFYSRYLGNSDVIIQMGYIDRPVPYPFMRAIPAAYLNFGIYIPYSFLTVRMNEFVSDTYAYLHWRHDFGKLLMRTKYFSPSLSIALNGAWGKLREPENHRNRLMLSPEKGLFEPGLIFDDIIRFNAYAFGAAVFYRVGYYSFPDWKDNISVSITLKLAS